MKDNKFENVYARNAKKILEIIEKNKIQVEDEKKNKNNEKRD